MPKEYLKMADEFSLPVDGDTLEMYCRQHIGESFESGEMYATHAINSHDELVAENERLREFERDAMRYRWLMQNTKLGLGRNGKDWDLQVDGPAPDSISEISAWIDNRMNWKM